MAAIRTEPLFSAQALTQTLQPLGVACEVVARTASTNSDLLARARKRLQDLPPAMMRVAEEQTAGRGRFDRSWVSAPGAVLTFSYGCHWPIQQQGMVGLSLVVGVAIQQGLQQLGIPVQLKWPNDILYQGRKLAGVLVESVVKDRGGYVVIGIGINLDVPSHVRLQIAQPVADVQEALQSEDQAIPVALAQAVLLSVTQALHAHVQQFHQHGFAPFHAQWNQLHAFQNKPVQLLDGTQIVATGLARGVDEYGQLLLETAAGMRRLRSGDISLRPL